METVYSDHGRLDERSLAMHRLVAEKVRANPALLDKARGNPRRWQRTEGSPKLALVEWERILGGTVDRVTQFLTERSERATRLRQSSPFAGILTGDERQLSPFHEAGGWRRAGEETNRALIRHGIVSRRNRQSEY